MNNTHPKTLGSVMISAPNSSAGKTLIILSLLHYFKKNNLPIMAGKSGPDYIDPLFHHEILSDGDHQTHAINFDSWAMRPQTLQALYDMAQDRLLLIEGAMGLYDGAGGEYKGSSAHLAHSLDMPIILILPVKRQSLSACAVLHGFLHYRAQHHMAGRVKGVILNGVGSARHEKMLRTALQKDFPTIPIVGAVPWQAECELPSRHLGLIQPEALPDAKAKITEIAEKTLRYLDAAQIEKIAKKYNINKSIEVNSDKPDSLNPLLNLTDIQHIAIARDQAFSFLYAGQLAYWRGRNITISFFSILRNEAPAPDADMIFLPGGYPELFAEQISNASHALQAIKHAVTQGVWLYGECGGYMVLGKQLIDKNGTAYDMLGLLPHSTNMQQAQRQLGYRTCKIQAGTPFAGEYFTAHEFHYSVELTDPQSAQNSQSLCQPLFIEVQDANQQKIPDAGGIKGRVMGSYFHLIDMVE